ncbi:MAG: hypothetical protein HFH75_19320 [Lachnospiraceae bacterium]|jgi:hypothetical protein|nr:hypothetical protein [Lachnospiraceae bacterium]MCI8969684.1 hypothetical protein [Lachnospiraceae bacterium]
MFPIKKGDIVFNHQQSEELLKNGHISGRGKAYADGTVGGGKYLMSDGRISRPLQPGDRMYDMLQKFNAYFNSIDQNVEKLTPNSFYDHQKQMEQMANQITNYNNVVNNNKNVQPSVNVGDIHITCPGVTSYEVMREVKTQINNEVRGLHNYADQQSRIR